MEAYFDNSATTRSFDEVARLVIEVMTKDYGNPSSMHIKGMEADQYLRQAKEIISGTLKAKPKEIIFTSGGTESDNLAILGAAHAHKRKGKHIITTSIEHPAVLNTMKHLEEEGFEVTYLPVNSEGVIELDRLQGFLRPDTILVSIMHTNNEIGSVQPIEEAGAIIKDYSKDILFHVDAVQGYGKYKIKPRHMHIDLLSASGHKIHGPKGVGFLYIGEGVRILPIEFGGGQQGGLRSGTENVPGIAGLGQAAKMLYDNIDKDIERLYGLKEYFLARALEIEDTKANGPKGKLGAPHIASVSFKGIRSETLLHALEGKGIYVSSGSACASNSPSKSSATLTAIGLDVDMAQGTIRFSLSVFTTKEEIDYALGALYDIVPILRKYKRG